LSRVTAPLTTTSFAVLGLLAIQPWTTYELAQQMDRTLGRMWPRAQSKIYEEPKKLAKLGMARAAREKVGQRPRTVYSITPKGRRALAEWLEVPGAPPSIEYEQLLKVFFAEHGTKSALVAQLQAARAWALAERDLHLTVTEDYLAGRGRFPQRAAILSLTGRFVWEFNEMLLRWSEFALDVVRDWPDDPTDADVDWSLYEYVLAQRARSDGTGATSSSRRTLRR
jgi:DNA-binding PadR family transcriptional regulator